MAHSRLVYFATVVCLLAVGVVPASPQRRSGPLVAPRVAAGAPDGARTALGGPSGSNVLRLDDGSAESPYGVGVEGTTIGYQAVYLNAFSPAPSELPLTIDSVSILFPVSYPGLISPGLFAGQSFDALVYVDPDGTGHPPNARLVSRTHFDLEPSNTVFQTVALDQAVTVTSGTVYVGFTDPYVAHTREFIYPAATDEDTLSGASYIFYSADQEGADFDGEDLSTAAGFVVQGTFLIRASYTTGGSVRICWDQAAGDGAPPTNNRVCTPAPGAKCGECSPISVTRDAPTGYNVYRGDSPNVQPSPETFFTSVPPGQTTASAGVTPGGSFFVVTATYDTGESGPSNEVGVVPPTVTSLVVSGSKVTVKGSGFMAPVQILVDGVPFATPPKVKGGTKVKQKGTLVTGETASAYLAAHGSARFTILNSNGALVALTKP